MSMEKVSYAHKSQGGQMNLKMIPVAKELQKNCQAVMKGRG